MRGKLIVIEGTDCSGKETQTKRLIKRLREENIFMDSFSFPNYQSPTGRVIAGPILGKYGYTPCWFEEGTTHIDPRVASLYYAADRVYNIDKINLLLQNGANVILDRYIYSNMAHQGGKLETAKERQVMYEWLDDLEFGLLKLPKPDIAVFLHMPLEGTKELKKQREELPDGAEKDLEHLKKAEEAYLEVASRYNMFTIECVVNDKVRSIEEINNDLYDYIIKQID